MSKSQYMSRALQHSRRLLSIYLASQNSKVAKSRKTSAKLESASSYVEFSTKHEEPHSTSPPDVTNLDFNSTDVVETLASSQLSTVIQSYNRTIELLMSHGERDLVAQASNELADLFYHQGNKRAAHKWWTTALDQILRCKDSIHEWRKSIKDADNIPSHFLGMCGVWGCLLAISLACKIGELTMVDVNMKSGCALLAADLVRSIFRSSLPHPTADFDYASYEIIPSVAESSLYTSPVKARSSVLKSRVQSNNLMNGIDIFSDRFRCSLQSVVASLHWLCDTLVSFKFNLPALPALTFYQYLATFVCRDLQRSVHCRCQKLSALIDLRMFKEATNEAINLLYGVRLPHPSDVSYASPDTPVPTVTFNTKKLIEDVENLKAMEVIASKRLSPSLSTLYGPHLTCEVTLGQARLLTSIASSITKIPEKPTAQDLQFVSPDFQAEVQHRTVPLTPKSGSFSNKLPHLSDDVRSNISAFSSASASKYVNKLFTKRERPVGQQLLKGMLLSVAEHLTAVMTHTFETSSDALMSSELYLLVSGHYLLSEIYQQRQLSTVSAAQALQALQVLQNSPLFDDLPSHTTRKLRSALRKKKISTQSAERNRRQSPQAEPYQVMEQLYRTRLNARLWLDCRLRMCQALATQIKGLGKVGSTAPDSAGLLDHSQVQLYCAEGLAEAEACDDVEMQAMFLILGSSLDGISIEESMHMLEDASSSLDEQAELSNRAALGLIECTTRFADLSIISSSASGQESIISYKSAHSVLLLKAMQEGEIISHCDSGGELSTVSSPPRNIYSTYSNLLAQIKLRIAHAMLQSAESVGDDEQVAAQLLTQARSLSSLFVGKETQLMADIQIELGKVQRMLIRSSSGPTGSNQSKAAHSSLREAVKLSEGQTSDLTTVRQAHLETALVDLVTIETKYSNTAQPPTELDRASSSPSVSAGGLPVNTSQRSFSLDVGVVSQPLELTQAKMRVATALFSAYHAARGIQQRAVLPGNPQVTALTFNPEDKAALPDFVLLDLTTDHTNLPWTSSSGDDITVEPLLNAVRSGNSELTWIHVLMYYVLLQRKSRLSSLVASGNAFDDERPPSNSDDSDRMTSFEPAIKSTPVRLPLNSGDLLLRIWALHEYLSSRLPAYHSSSHVPALPRGKNYAAFQWSREPGARNTALMWCVYHAEGATVDCGRGEVPTKTLQNISMQVNALRKRTEEFFGRVAAQSEVTSRRRKSQRGSVVVTIDAQLEEDWKHLLNQIVSLISSSDEPISQMPFDITLETAQSLVELFIIGCCVDSGHPMYKWLLQLLCPV
uniref:Cilia- and flagella-associated protein 54-like n=1 Tax=Phallusia mammillata TaxID=59560 RepID=A0A6F9D9Q4_9ASCI|nr:cilia- and flagella-associated protein 54-like [Phallusia mammillata]